VVEKKVHVHDLHATLLHLLGFDREKLTDHDAGRDFRLTEVHGQRGPQAESLPASVPIRHFWDGAVPAWRITFSKP